MTTASLPYGFDRRRSHVKRLLVRILLAPSTVTDEDRALVARYIASASLGTVRVRFDLRAELRKRAWTIKDFARRLGVSPRVVAYWLRGQRQPSFEMARCIAHTLGLSPLRVMPNFASQQHISTALRKARDDNLGSRPPGRPARRRSRTLANPP